MSILTKIVSISAISLLPLVAEESAFSSSLSAEYASQYLFRGIQSGEDIALLSYDLGWKKDDFNAYLNLWQAQYHSAVPTIDESAELDVTAGVSYDFDIVKLSTGYIYYHKQGLLRELQGDSHEIFVGVSKDFGVLNAALTYYGNFKPDYVLRNQGYMDLVLSKNVKVCDRLSFDFGSMTAYLAEKGKVPFTSLKAAANVTLCEKLTLTPYIIRSWTLLNDSSTAYATNKDEWSGGAVLKYSF